MSVHHSPPKTVDCVRVGTSLLLLTSDSLTPGMMHGTEALNKYFKNE